jgi:hypothetical protein
MIFLACNLAFWKSSEGHGNIISTVYRVCIEYRISFSDLPLHKKFVNFL